MAAQIAQAGDGIYVNGASRTAPYAVDEKMEELAQGDFERKSFSPQSEQFPVFGVIALILLMIYFHQSCLHRKIYMA